MNTYEISTEITSELARIKDKAAPILEAIHAKVIITDRDSSELETLQASCAGFIKEVNELIDGPKKEAHAHWKSYTGLSAEITDPFVSAKLACSQKVGTYKLEAEQQAAREQAAADQQAREEKEAQDLEEAEMVRESAGDEAANAYLEEAVSQPVERAVVESQVYSRPGSSVRKSYSVKILDKSKVPSKYMVIDEKYIASEARRLKADFDCKTDSGEVWAEVVVTAGNQTRG